MQSTTQIKNYNNNNNNMNTLNAAQILSTIDSIHYMAHNKSMQDSFLPMLGMLSQELSSYVHSFQGNNGALAEKNNYYVPPPPTTNCQLLNHSVATNPRKITIEHCYPTTANYNSSSSVKVTNKRRRVSVESHRQCCECGSTETIEWRTGPKGPATLCNACGLRYWRRNKRRANNAMHQKKNNVNNFNLPQQQQQQQQQQEQSIKFISNNNNNNDYKKIDNYKSSLSYILN